MITPDTEEQESQETPAAETAESPEKQQAEQEAGTEQHGNVPEDFQQQVQEMLEGLSIPEVEYLETQITDKLKALRKSETPAEKKQVFDTEGMPE